MQWRAVRQGDGYREENLRLAKGKKGEVLVLNYLNSSTSRADTGQKASTYGVYWKGFSEYRFFASFIDHFFKGKIQFFFKHTVYTTFYQFFRKRKKISI